MQFPGSGDSTIRDVYKHPNPLIARALSSADGAAEIIRSHRDAIELGHCQNRIELVDCSAGLDQSTDQGRLRRGSDQRADIVC